MEKILQFLKENPTFYYATVDGGAARVRPFGFYMEYEGNLYFGMGKHKASYRQTLANPQVEICTANEQGVWIRTRGAAVFDESPDVAERAFAVMPSLRNIYNETSGLTLAIFYLADGVAEIADMQGHFESISF